ncbi:MAG: hypothetical protein RLZZ524_3144 [Pseudomonadota bacterium]
MSDTPETDRLTAGYCLPTYAQDIANLCRCLELERNTARVRVLALESMLSIRRRLADDLADELGVDRDSETALEDGLAAVRRLRAEVGVERACVRLLLRYCESSTGERGDLLGCAIGAETWRQLAKIGGAS